MMHRRIPLLLLAALWLISAAGLADVKSAGSARCVEIRGAATMSPMAFAVAERFMADHPEVVVTVAAGGAHRGIKSVLVGNADLGLAGDVVPEEYEKYARDHGIRLVKDHVYTDALVVVVHDSNPIGNLSLAQLRDIYRGAIVNWKDVGGADAPITVVSHEGTTGTYETFKLRVLGDDALVTQQATLTKIKGFDKAMSQNANTIGYIGAGQAGTWKRITIDGAPATPEAVQSGRYPIWRPLMVYHVEPLSPLARQVLDYFLAPDKGQAIVRSLGDVPAK